MKPYCKVLWQVYFNAYCFVVFSLENKTVILIGRQIRKRPARAIRHGNTPWTTRTWSRSALRLRSCPWAHGIMGCLWDTVLVWRAAERPVWPLAFILLLLFLRRRGVVSVQAPGLRVGWGGGGWRLGGTELLPTHAGSVHLLLLHQFRRVDEVPAVEEDHAGRHHARRAPEQHIRQRLCPGFTWEIQEPAMLYMRLRH